MHNETGVAKIYCTKLRVYIAKNISKYFNKFNIVKKVKK